MSHLKIGDISCSQEANMYLLLSSICAVTEHINNDKQTTKIIQLDRGSERLWPHNKTVNTNRQTHTLSSSQLLCNSVSRSPAVWTHTLSCDPLFSVMAGNDCLRYRSNTFRTSSEPETQEYSNEQSLAFQTLSQSHIRRVIQRSCDRITVRREFSVKRCRMLSGTKRTLRTLYDKWRKCCASIDNQDYMTVAT